MTASCTPCTTICFASAAARRAHRVPCVELDPCPVRTQQFARRTHCAGNFVAVQRFRSSPASIRSSRWPAGSAPWNASRLFGHTVR